MSVKVTPLIYEQIRRKRPELQLPMWPELLPEDKKRAKRMTIDKLITMRVTKLLKRDPEVTDRIQVIGARQAGSWQRQIEWIGADPIL